VVVSVAMGEVVVVVSVAMGEMVVVVVVVVERCREEEERMQLES